LKSIETGKSVGNTGLPIGIIGKPIPKTVNHFFQKKIIFFKKSESLTGLSKIGETGPDRFIWFLTGFSIHDRVTSRSTSKG
jgi:hypothetical protein